jgi:transcriptional regulator with XRE-family HTH domain
MKQMSFGKRLAAIRKQQGISQDKLASMLGTKGSAIGRYERDGALPALESIIKLSKALGVSIDYLVGMVEDEIKLENSNRLVEIQQLPEDVQEKIFYFVDMAIRDTKAKLAYNKEQDT